MPAIAMDPITNLFVYGTLTDPAQLRRILGRSCPTLPGFLAGYERRQGRYPYLVQMAGREVTGSIICNLNREDFAKLDDYEVMRPA